jgi:S1-C subfamily serine protease
MKHFAIFALLLFTANCGAEDKAISVKTIATIMRSIVPIVCAFADAEKGGQVSGIIGTGFLIDTNGRFVTAGHVLDDWGKVSTPERPCQPAVFFPDTGWGHFTVNIKVQFVSFSDCARAASVDLAVCSLASNPFTSSRIPRGSIEPVSFDTEEKPIGTPIAFTGFPLQMNSPVASQGIIAGVLADPGEDQAFGYAIDKSEWPGASGSPAYISNGKVVGIVYATGISLGAGLTYSRSASVIVDFLSKHPFAAKQETITH